MTTPVLAACRRGFLLLVSSTVWLTVSVSRAQATVPLFHDAGARLHTIGWVAGVADFDGDGWLDVLDLEHRVHHQVAPGRFRARVATGPLSVDILRRDVFESASLAAIGDVDGDGAPDAIVAARSYLARNTGMQVLLNRRGDLVRAAFRPIRPQGGAFEGFADGTPHIGDLDGDGDADLLVVSPDGVFVFVNDGGGSFADETERWIPPFEVARGEGFGGADLGDLDGDGDLDVVLGDRWLLINDGRGRFAVRDQVWTTPGREGSWLPVELADLDGDGDLDLLCADGRLAENVGGTLFDRTDAARLGEGEPLRRTAVDWDGDGDLDVVGGPGAMFRNDGGWNFVEDSAGRAPASLEWVLAFADLDGDGDQDWISSVEFGRNDGSGRFAPAGYGDEPRGRVAFDVDGDGDEDWILESSVALNDGRGAFPTRLPLPQPLYLGPSEPVVADIDGDGDLDLVAANAHPVSLPGGRPPIIAINDGAGRLTQEGFGRCGPLQYASVLRIASDDLDRDGDLDLLIYVNRWQVWENDGAGYFSRVATLPPSHARIAFADLDLDGDRDIVLELAQSTTALRHDGSLGFTADPALLPAAVRTAGQTVSLDADGDGRDDLFHAGATASLLLRTPSGWNDVTNAALPLGLYPSNAWRSLDANADGEPDLVTDDGMILLNDGGGRFLTRVYGWRVLADLDGDGDPDGENGHWCRERQIDLVVPFAPGGTAELGCYHKAGYNPAPAPMWLFADWRLAAQSRQLAAGSLSLDPATAVHIGTVSCAPYTGEARQAFPLPPTPALVGAPLFVQGIVPRPGGLAATNVLDTVVY